MIAVIIILTSLSLLVSTDPDPVHTVAPEKLKSQQKRRLTSATASSLKDEAEIPSEKSWFARALSFVSPCQ